MQSNGRSAMVPRRTTRSRDTAPRVVVISPDVAASVEWATRLHKACAPRFVVRAWGDQLAYEYLRRASGVLALLDSPGPEPTDDLVQRIRSLRLLAPVTVSVSTRVDCAALLAAGAVNVLRRNTSENAIAARIEADLRWLRRGGPAAHGDTSVPGIGPDRRPGPLRPYRSQSLLLEILLGAQGPLCCHDVRWLLGEASRPMSLRALRARIERLAPHLARHGLTCDRSVRWGADTFTLHPLAGGTAAPARGETDTMDETAELLPA
ncbi:hypothetical protein ACIQNU_41100 [Streptomyces sp. NPDC091292]|uniref:hypothetical protein n=1 Tax=Streptomyces sp. NPDC091292 TaxID=3365991 RepID=UPI0037F3099F